MSIRKNMYIADDVINHLEKQPNMSFYINKLIRHDKDNIKITTKHEVLNIIQSYLKDYSPNENTQEKNDSAISDAILNTLEGGFE